MIPCLEGVCTDSSECNEPCKSKGYQGGACVRMSIDLPTGACCFQYKVLFNGQPRELIVPERGLRQGDLLSPYLFILCTEVLIANIRKAEESKTITGIKVATPSPAVFHLLFADDSLFLCKANVQQYRVILSILRQYESVSGQQINFDKSSLQFGHTIGDDVQNEVKTVLGITKLGGMDSYLRLPEILGGSKTKIFSFVRDRLLSRTNGWTAKFLSKERKEVMIKSVDTALPTYIMSCFRLPKIITKKLTSAIAKFWWSTNGQTGGMHWPALDKMCHSKADGGIGFWNVDDYNTSLLEKKLWRLITVLNSLFVKVFKGRYKYFDDDDDGDGDDDDDDDDDGDGDGDGDDDGGGELIMME
ncbi:Reverse transcriptase domain [Arabidopsis suecica]|uniref:Reverse transcriptase domain n=1 Tax=Arabidopsis suecica TaxID=45249 RepID=A0A8T1XSB3_ARASU|nr:Reverse transcriptase domain [Arabidopsis suecica]